MRHHMSYQLRTMLGLVNRAQLDEAADELDRLNALIVDMTTKSASWHTEANRRIRLLEERIRELEKELAAK